MAKVYLDSGDTFALSGAASVYGSTGTEKVIVNTGVTGVVVDANVERVDLPGASSAYTYQQAGNQLKVFSGTTLVATIPLQDDADGTQVVFSNGSVSAKVGATGLTLGGATVPSAAAAAVTPTTIDATVTSGSGSSSATGQAFSLTTGVDSGTAFTGGSGNDTFNSVPFVSTAGTETQTFGALDALDGGAGEDTLNISNTAAAFTIPTSATVKNIETANINSGGTVVADVSTWTGLTKLTVGQYGGSAGESVTGAATTDITLTDSAAAATTTNVQGGKNVNVTLNGVTKLGALNVGTTTAVTGTLDVTTNMLASQTGVVTADAITTKGGTTVNITANLTEQGGVGNTVTGGAIGVTGTSATTTVTVKQSAAATAVNEVTAATGVLVKTAVTAAPGQNGVTAVTAVAPATAKAAVAGVVNGAVTITDSAAATGLGTIKTVTLENYGASTITSNALTDLTLKGTAGTLTLTRDASFGASDTLNLTLSSLSGTNTITDTNNEIKTLNVKATGGNSTLAAFADTGLKTLNVSGDKLLSLGTVNTSLTKLAVSESASFSGDVSALGAALDFTTTSSGSITATLDAATQKFTGSTGVTNITISADAKAAITGGSGSSDKLVLNSNVTNFNTTANVTDNKGLTKLVSGFEVLGTGTASQGVYDVTLLPGGLKAVSMDGNAAAAISFTKLVDNTSLAINAGQTDAVTYQLANASGVANTASLTLGNAANTTGFIVADLTLKDANDVGVGTLNVTSNASTWLQGHTITKLTDNGLSTLNVSGNASLTITDLTQSTTQATAFTVNNTLTGADDAVTITTLGDANLGALTFTGSGNSTVGTLAGLTGKVLTVSNTGTGTASIGNIGVSGLAGGTTEVNTVVLAAGLAPGEAMTVAGRIVTNDSGTTTFTATQVAQVLSGGTAIGGLTLSGTLTGWTAAVSATNSIVLTSTTASTNVGPASYSDAVRPAATAVAMGTVIQGDGTTTNESVTWTMQGLTNGQSVTIDGLSVTAQKTLTATEVAAAFVAGVTSAGNYTVGGTFTDTAGWTGESWSNVGADLKLTSAKGGFGNENDMTTGLTPVVSTAGSAITDATVLESTPGAAASGAAQALTTITMNGNVAWGANDNTTAATAIGANTGVTVDGATNNAHVNIQLNAAAAGSTNTIKLGNANNYITDLTTAGTVKINVGSGGNLIDIKAGAASTYLAEVTLGAHTNTSTVFNTIRVSDASGQATSYSTVITGAAKGDVLQFNNGANIVWDAVTTAEQANITGAANLATAVTLAFGTLGTTAHKATSFTYGGDTYVIQDEGTDGFTSGTDSIVKLTGIVTVADNGTTAGQVIIA